MGWFKKSSSSAARSASPESVQQQSQQQTSSRPTYIAPRESDTLSNLPTTEVQPTKDQLAERYGDSCADALMVIDRPPTGGNKKGYADIEADDSQSTRDQDDVSNVKQERTRQNHLNSLFNGHLMKWKYEAEEGSPFIRVPAFFGALGSLVTSIVAAVIYPGAWTTHNIVMTIAIVIMSIFVLVLDGRFLNTNPLSARAHLRNIMTRNFNIFRFLWGRGLLYITAGILSVSEMWLMTIISGSIMILIGVIAVIVGVYTSRKFASLRNSLADESFLLLVFSNYDSDGDGYVVPREFSLLLTDLGMELDDRYTLKAFNVIDSDNDRRISYDEFSHWWSSGYIARGRKHHYEEDELTYTRM